MVHSQIPMDISGAKNHAKKFGGNVFIFLHGYFIFMHEMKLKM